MNIKKDSPCIVEDFGFETIEKILFMIGGKWKMQIIYHIGRAPKVRYGQLKKMIPAVSHKVLTAQLKALEQDGLISRVEHFEIPIKVEYSLTDLGNSLLPVYEVFGNWCEEHRGHFQHNKRE